MIPRWALLGLATLLLATVAGAVPITPGILDGGQYNLTPPTLVDGQVFGLQLDSAGRLIVNLSGGSGGTPNQVQPVPGTSGGCTPYHLSGGTTASNNSTSMKGSAGNLCDLVPINTTANIYYLKIYDTAGAPTCSSATGLKHVFPIPANVSSLGAGMVRSLALGESYVNGIGFCVTGGGGDTDNSNAATGVYIEASYK